MTQEIWKFPVPRHGLNVVRMPGGAQPMSAGVQRGSSVMLWALVHPSATLEDRVVYLLATGEPVPAMNGQKYVSTVFDGPFVWHVFA